MSQPADLIPALEQEFLPETAAPSRWRERVRRYLPAVAVFVIGLIVWEAVVTVFRIEGFLLPRPSVIAQTFVRDFSIVAGAGWNTLGEAVGGFLMGSALGIAIALATARWSTLSEGLMPFAIAVNSTPIIALAPITINWFGSTNSMSKMSIVAVIVFFPVMINMVRGLTLIDPGALDLMRSYAAGPRAVLFKVRLPNSFSYLFSAFKVAATLSVIAAIVSEYFGGPNNVLGVYISQQAALFHFAEAWSAIIIGCIMGVAFYLVIVVIERLVMPWHASFRTAET